MTGHWQEKNGYRKVEWFNVPVLVPILYTRHLTATYQTSTNHMTGLFCFRYMVEAVQHCACATPLTRSLLEDRTVGLYSETF